MTEFFRKYYNQAISSDHRRTWPQKGKQKRELRVESQRQDQNQEKSLNPNLRVRKNHLVDIQLAFREEKKLSKMFLVKEISLQVK